MATLELKQVHKSFGSTHVLKSIDLTIHDGEFVVFVGPSGCGKSTLLRMIAGLEELSDGELLIDGVRASQLPPDRRGLAMVFQSYALYPHMTVADNMGFSLRLHGVPKAERDAKIAQAARILEIEPLLGRKPGQLSGGQRQRVAIGRAIVRAPKAFLFDEPLSNLDAALRVQMRLEIAKLHRTLKGTTIYVTHDQVEAMTLADRIVVMRAGIIEQVGTPLELYHQPANRFVAGFIGSPRMNFLTTKVAQSQGAQCSLDLPGGGQLSLALQDEQPHGTLAPHGAELTLGLRPEDLRVTEAGPLRGQVQQVEHLGSETFLYVQVGSEELITVKTPATSPLRPGDPVALDIDPSRCSLFDSADQALPLAASTASAAAPRSAAG